MRKALLLNCLLLIATNLYSQNQGVGFKYEVLDPKTSGKLFRNPAKEVSKPKGIPYSQLLFLYAKVENVAQKSLMRYNIYKDEFEFIVSKDTLILDKINDFSPICFVATNTQYKLLNYTGTDGKLVNGYLITIYQTEGCGLFKKESVAFYEEKIAKTTLESNKPARFEKQKVIYFLKNKKNEIFEFPNNKKRIIKLFPDKKEAIELFFKENKVDFDKEIDLIKMIDFLNTL